MKTKLLVLIITSMVTYSAVAETTPNTKKITAKEVEIPKDFRQWQRVATSYRTDKNSLRVIIANDIAWKAIQEGGKHFPDGAKIGKLTWKEKHHEKWDAAIVPGEFQNVDFMQKDSKKYAATGGWSFSRWLGVGLKRDSKDIEGQECLACHTIVKDSDYVFTQPAIMPK